MKLLSEERTGLSCLVERSWMAAFDSPEYWNPKVRGAECLNRQAARSIVPIAELRTRMVMAGHSKAEIVSALKAAFANKQLPDLESGNMVYMMSKSAYLYDAGDHNGPICGSFWGTRGPVDGIAADPMYLDVSVQPGKRKALPIATARNAFAYVFAGTGNFCNTSGPLTVPTESVKWLDTAPPSEADNRSLVLFDSGDEIVVQAGDDGIRFLLVSGVPLKEPVAWYGPIVMNTQEQLQQAFEELREGTFLNPRT